MREGWWCRELGKATLCIFISLPSQVGGAERIFIRLANHLAKNGQEVHLIVNHSGGPLRDLVSDTVELHVLGKAKAMRALPRLVTHLRTHEPAALISALTRTNLAALIAARLAGRKTPVVVCERNQFSTLSAQYNPLRRVLVTRLVRLLYPSARAVIGNTDEVTRDISAVARLSAERTGVIHNPAPELAQIEEARATPPAEHPWFQDDRPVAIAMGRLVPQKDYSTMLRALAGARPDLRLMVLGDGPDRAALEAEAQALGMGDRVAFLGFCANRFAYLVQADLFLISSVTEGFPNALIEAVSAGVPAISTDCAGNGAREILGADFPDRIVPVGGDAGAMAAVIDKTLAPPKDLSGAQAERDRLAAIAERYQIGQIAEAFLNRAVAA